MYPHNSVVISCGIARHEIPGDALFSIYFPGYFQSNPHRTSYLSGRDADLDTNIDRLA
jgi:hypothetical protein